MVKEVNKKVDEYLSQPYTFILEQQVDNEKPYYSMKVLELEGCMTTGDTVEEAAEDIKDAMQEWLELNIKQGKAIPLPLKSKRYSGKIILRMPPALHESLMFKATQQGVSLNQYLVASLSHTLGYDEGAEVGLKSRRPTTKRSTVKSN